MSFNKLKIAFLAGTSLLILSCNNETPVQPAPEPASPVINRLIFNGTAHTGGDVTITLNDTKLEAVLDGNPRFANLPALSGLPMLPPRFSLISAELTELNYYGETVTISCAESSSSLIPLEWHGDAGSFYQNSNGIMYVYDTGMSQYFEQQDDDALSAAVIPDYSTFSAILGNGYLFYIECTGSDGLDYRVSFYDRSTPEAHSITTTFSVEEGTVEGILRVHRIGDGHHPFLDILL